MTRFGIFAAALVVGGLIAMTQPEGPYRSAAVATSSLPSSCRRHRERIG